MQDPDLQGPRSATTPHLEDCTPYSDDHAACWGLAGRRRDLRKTKDDIHDDCHVRRHAPQYISYSIRTLHPRDSGENDDFRDPLNMYPSLLMSIKGGAGLPLRGSIGSLGITPLTEHTLAPSPNNATRHAPLLF